MSFFADFLLFDNHAAFVFFGSKPLVSFTLNHSMTKEEEKALFNRLPPSVQKNAKIVFPPYDLWKCWLTWKKYQPQNPNPKFVIFETSSETEPSSKNITIVNIDRTVEILILHYSHFREVFGRKFSPNKIIGEISNPNSEFWKIQFSNHISKGLLFGYGKRNAVAFNEMILRNEKIENFIFSTNEKISPYASTKRKFTIPIFRTYEDEKIAKIYERERKNIKAALQKKNTLQLIFQKLEETR